MLVLAGIFAWLAVSAAAPLGLDLVLPTPEDNPLAPAKVDLGRRLFSDRRLSRDGTVACASCHDPSRAFSDGRAVAVGVAGRTGVRNAPALINRGYGASFFWDGRASTLEAQVLQPLLDTREMAATRDSVLQTLRGDRQYRRLFRAAFDRDPEWEDVGRALASFVRTIRSGNSPYDRFRNGDESALTDQQQRGMRIFFGSGNCWSCHKGASLTDERFHNTGVAFRPLSGRSDLSDEGRFLITKHPADLRAFKTPTLREIARTAPYMHDGSIATLEDVVDHYDRGGSADQALSGEIRPLNLSVDDKRALVAFLRSLSGRIDEPFR
jgi:cytochrome c peroxidase